MLFRTVIFADIFTIDISEVNTLFRKRPYIIRQTSNYQEVGPYNTQTEAKIRPYLIKIRSFMVVLAKKKTRPLRQFLDWLSYINGVVEGIFCLLIG